MAESSRKVALRATWAERARRLELGDELSDLEPGAGDDGTDTDELSDTCPVTPSQRLGTDADTTVDVTIDPTVDITADVTSGPLDDSGATSSDVAMVDTSPRWLDVQGPSAARLRSALRASARATADRQSQLATLNIGTW